MTETRRSSMGKGSFIMTPGVECDNSSTQHYSVFATQNSDSLEERRESEKIFSNPLVGGALFLQHHMMKFCEESQKHVARPQSEIRGIIQAVCAVNPLRIEQGHAPVFCAFDAEPAPVQARRYVHNPPGWPSDAMAQAEYLFQQLEAKTWSNFINDIIDTKAYYPMLPDHQTLGKIAQQHYDKAEMIAHAVGTITGRVMGSLGINVLFAPVCDLGAQAFPERCFSKNKQITIGLTLAWCRGALAQNGVDKICLKHAPGHGVEINHGQEDAQDTHNKQCISYDAQAVVDEHLSVFTDVTKQLISEGHAPQAILVMTNHITYAAIDRHNPVSSSQKAMEYLQQRLPEGVDLVADCINMAGFADSKEQFGERLDICRALHSGGVIATTHYVKKMSRVEMLSIAMPTR